MKYLPLALGVALTLPVSSPAGPPAAWPTWRGPDGSGAAPDARPPIEWSDTRNIRWKVPIPGRGHASPIVWGEHVFVQTAVPTDTAPSAPITTAPTTAPASEPTDSQPAAAASDAGRTWQFRVLALERRTGRIAWERTVCETPLHERGHADSTPASNSPVTDGEQLIAYFGSRGVYGLDLAGRVLWQKDLGRMQTRREFGEGSSPALHGDTVVITWDHEGEDFIVALDKRTGAERWRTARDEPTSWATPVIVTADGGLPQVIASATNRIRAYDLADGTLLWECGGMTGNVIPTPVAGHGLVYCISGFRDSALLAIRYAGARGDIAGTPAVAWTYDQKGTPYVPSPLLYGDELYFLQENRPVLSCVDARSGRTHYGRQRLEELRDVYASLVGAGDHVYVVGRDGRTVVLRRGPEFAVVATNVLDDSFSASPAIADRELFLRGREHLYCIAE